MEINEILKKFKKIHPDADYSKRSKQIILSAGDKGIKFSISVWEVFIKTLQSGSAIVLTIILFLVILGASSNWRLFSPSQQISSLDPTTLKAEAQAIDAQIELAKIAYQIPNKSLTNSKTTTQAILSPAVEPNIKEEVKKEAENLGLPVSSSSQNMTIDQALQKLSE